jgi:hypothetical protein
MINKVHQILFGDAGVPQQTTYLSSATDSVQQAFPSCEYTLWDLSRAEAFLRENFPPELLAAFQSLVPYAYKADLLKYCLMQRLGGWYVDAGVRMLQKPVEVLQDPDALDLVVFRATGLWDAAWACSVALIYARPDHTVFKSTIAAVLENCRQQHYGINPLSPTMAPFGRALALHDVRENIAVGTVVDVQGESYARAYQLKPYGLLAARKPRGNPAGAAEQMGISGGNNYVELWESRGVYQSLEGFDEPSAGR